MNKISEIAKKSEEAISIKYNNIVYELKQQGKKVIVLSLGEAYFDIPLFQFTDLPFPDLYHYSHSRGIIGLRKKIAGYFNSEYNFKFDPETEILITAGSKAAIHMAFMAVLNPDDEVIVKEPAWVSYFEEIKLCYGLPVSVPVNENYYDIEKYITPKTKVIILNNPHNPTGYVIKKDELLYLHNLAKKHNIWIFSDEAYSDFVTDDSFLSFGQIDKKLSNTVVFNSISKNFGISGWRLGYAISNQEFIYNLLKINQHLITCPSTILAQYVDKYFDKIISITKPQIAKVVEKRNKVNEIIKKTELKTINGTATFYFFVSISPSKLSSDEFCTKLLYDELISTVPGIGYGKSCDKYIRLSIGTATMEEIEYSLQKIKELINKTV